MNKKPMIWFTALACLAAFICIAASPISAQPPGSIGQFGSHADIGTVLHPGGAEYDLKTGTYTLTASGENMWFRSDAFQFVWKKVSGDVALSADISFVGQGGNPHRKAVVMLRQNLDPDSV